MNYAMFLITAAGTELAIPVLPDKLKITSPGKNKTATVLGLGEVLLLRQKGLRGVAWEGFFPAHDAPCVTGALTPPPVLVKAIQEARDSLEPLRLLLLGNDLDLNWKAGVDSFDYEERGGAVGDIYYSIKLTEWKDCAPRMLELKKDGGAVEGAAARGGTPGPAPRVYTVASGDSLWAIAKRTYGDGRKWNDIYAANKAVVGANPNRIYPGQVLTLP